MESPARSIVKAITWQLLGLVTMTALAWLATGSLAAAGGLAISGALSGFVCFILHERLWARISWGRGPQ
ncbi:DUF2061 domain-containing protein [Devosia salina]|uniref:DUF2061 domain-containing protein n=1 Tax=Devosia salina TaxID=2860336 RepID=A0ABX8WGD3_9HYPH|nr:DUF2061 domain-containing protein [Devosia salina]QYO75350.1 DUF2061 domain-containing protein [Devosia salina]